MNGKIVRIVYMSFGVLFNIAFVRGLTYTSIVKTSSGPVRGFISKTIENFDYAGFKGIPYAEPPVNGLRFKPPLEVIKWTNVYDAVRDGTMCTQYNSTDKTVVGSENCLFINVFTPHTEFDGCISKPVMVWIYGGGFTSGSADQSSYGPDFILKEDVILVTFNYRVGVLGLLNLQHENAIGNYGLKDQSLALKWVKRNIAMFGGNPDMITIFGHSAGATSVDLHIISDMSVGLFRQSISMSGGALNVVDHWGLQSGEKAVQNAFILGSKLGINTTSTELLLETLRNVPAADIIIASNDMGILPFRPSLEKAFVKKENFLNECSLNKYVSGDYVKGPHMLGFSANETVAMIDSLVDLSKKFELKNDRSDMLKNIPSIGSAMNYRTAKSNPTGDSIYQLIKETTDILFILGVDTKQKLISHNNNHPIYYYRFSFESNYSSHKIAGVNLHGVGHGDELPYIFYIPSSKLSLNKLNIKNTRRRMVKLWINFAKYGDPTPSNDVLLGINWPDSRPNGLHLNIDRDLTIGSRPVSKFVEILQIFGIGSLTPRNYCTN